MKKIYAYYWLTGVLFLLAATTTNAQNIGIGTATPGQKLEIAGSSNTIRVNGLTSSGSYYQPATSNSALLYVNNATGDLYSLPSGTSGMVLSISSTGVPTWTAASAAVPGWALTGNTVSVTSGANVIGTLNAVPLEFISGGNYVGTLDYQQANVYLGGAAATPNAGNWKNGINTSTPGYPSGGANTVGIGVAALSSLVDYNTTNGEVYDNVAIGYFTAANFNPGSNTAYSDAITAVGANSMRWALVGPNDAFGYNTLSNIYLGTNNLAVGYNSLDGGSGSVSAGASMSYNTAVGENTMTTLTSGYYNTALGYGANVASAALSNTIAIGYNASAPATNAMVLGNTLNTALYLPGYPSAGSLLYTSAANGLVASVAAGTSGEVLQSNGTGAPTWVSTVPVVPSWNLTGNTGTTYGTNYVGTNDAMGLQFDVDGIEAGRIELNSTPFNGVPANETGNTALGYQALLNVGNGKNTAVGYQSGDGGSANAALGYQALQNSGGNYNVGVGNSAGYQNPGNNNTAVGYSSGYVNYGSGGNNTSVGANAMYVNYGMGTNSNNTAVGYQAMYEQSNSVSTNFIDNTAIGANALMTFAGSNNTYVGYANSPNTTGSNNTGIGWEALGSLSSGSDNTALGYNANVATGALSNATAIGYQANAPVSNSVTLGNASVTSLYLPGYSNANTLLYTSASNGLVASVAAGTSGQVLTANSAGVPTWSNPAATGVTSVAVTAPIVNTGSPSVPNIGIQGSSSGTDAGGVLYSTGSGTSAVFNSTGSSGQVLQSNGAAAPSWVGAGSVVYAVTNINSVSNPTYSPLTTDYMIEGDCSNGNIVVTLPDATTLKGKVYLIVRYDATYNSGYSLTLNTTAGQVIGQYTSGQISLGVQYNQEYVMSDGNNWVIITSSYTN